MSVAYVCGGCGALMEYYEDFGPYVEHDVRPCGDCEEALASFDAGFGEYESRLYSDASRKERHDA